MRHLRLFDELKERRVFRVAGVYALVAWAVMEAADVIFPALGLPDWAVTLVVALALLGFPIAIVLAWAYQVTPDGIVRDQHAAGIGRGVREGRAAYIGIGILVGLVGVGAYGLFSGGEADPPSASVREIRSVAVLPFADRSPRQDDEYFADGISEELLNALARVPELRVAARTSSFAFKDRNVDVREIADTLGVRAVLEGSVRRQDDRVRVHAQLVDATTGYDLWSDSYDREVTDIFALQDDIARAIVDALRIEILGGDGPTSGRLVRRATDNIEAHDLYLLGLHHWHRRGPALDTALGYFQRAVEIDPDYALAHAGVASTFAVAGYYLGIPIDEIAERGRAAAYRALELDPNAAEAHGALGHIAMNTSDWAAAERHLERAIELNPEYASAHQWLGELLIRLGRFDEAEDALEQARRLDPLSGVLHWQLLNLYGITGQWDDAIAAADRALQHASALIQVNFYLGLALRTAGRTDEALDRFHRLARSPEQAAAFERILAAPARAVPETSAPDPACLDAVEGFESDRWGPPLLNGDEVAFLYAICGAGDRAIAAVRRAYRRGLISVGITMVMYRDYDAIAEHPGYAELARDMDLAWVLEDTA